VACANAAARDAGIRAGQAVAAAKALAGALRVIDRDPAAEREALQRVAAWAAQFTPMVSIEAQGVLLEVESSLRLFHGHAKLTAAISRGIREVGFQATFGVAPTPLAARLFARAESQGRAVRSCLATADLAERVADLPLFLLEWPEKTLARLTDLGVLRLRDILASGIVAAGGPQYALKTGFDFGACSGTSHDYAYARHLISPDLPKVLGFVVEWGTLPYPDWVDMQKILVEVSAGLVNFSIATQHPLP